MTMRTRLLKTAKELLQNPTAPFREAAVRDYIKQFCAARGIAVSQDRMGNLIATYGKQYRNAVFAFGAHMDHPGFLIEKDSRKGKTTALFCGSVDKCFFKGSKVRVFGAREVTARVTEVVTFDRVRRVQRVRLGVDGRVKKGDFGMWDLPAFRMKNGRIYSRSCDDPVGCVSVLALFDELVRRKVRKKVMGIFTVAEEGGLNGATYLAERKRVPKSVRIIAIETSRAFSAAPIGGGVVVRVGDRLSVFPPAMTEFLLWVAQGVKSRDGRFAYRRQLMDGGVCESTVYSRFGYMNGAVCIPLGNYHNRNFRTKKIASEYVSADDLENMVKLFLGVVKHSEAFEKFLKPPPPTFRVETRALGQRLYFW